jgi:hypothetical protein
MKEAENRVKILFSIGGILVITIAMTLLIVTLGFFIGFTVSKWQFPAGFLLASGLYYFTAKAYYKDFGSYFRAVFISLAVIIISMVIATNFYDVSYDGQSYHMEEIYQLKNGWNPSKGELAPSVNMALYIDHYSKGVEIPQSTLYSITDRIETGKATNFMLLAASFCLTLALLLSGERLSAAKCILLSLFTALNPIAVNQLLTTYVDGQLAIMLLCFLVVATWAVRVGSNFSFLLLASIIIITSNIKFTGLVYIVLFSFAFLAWLALVNYQKMFFRKAFLVTLISGVVGVLVVGYSTYVENTIVHHHPFYPLMGENKVDIMHHNLPPGFEAYDGLSKFFLSLFAHSDNVMTGNNKEIKLKIPFTINKDDIVNSYAIDTRIAGFGGLFSGLIILSVIVVILLLTKYSGQWRYKKNWLYIIGLIIISIIIMPESWWARYVPQFWYLPIIALLMSELYIDNKFKILKISMYLCLTINVVFTLLSFRYNFIMTRLINAQLKEIKDSNRTIFVQFDSSESNRIRFHENGISYIERYIEKNPATKEIICSEAMYLIPSEKMTSPMLTKP